MTRAASFLKLTNSPSRRKAHTMRGEQRWAKQVQSWLGWKLRRAGPKRVPWLPSRGICWKQRDPRGLCLYKRFLSCQMSAKWKAEKMKSQGTWLFNLICLNATILNVFCVRSRWKLLRCLTVYTWTPFSGCLVCLCWLLPPPAEYIWSDVTPRLQHCLAIM